MAGAAKHGHKSKRPRNVHPHGEHVTRELAHVEGRLKASSIRTVDKLVDRHPNRALTVLRNWLHQG